MCDHVEIHPHGSMARDTTISAATTLAKPTSSSGALWLFIQAFTQNVRITFDGTTPTATVGFSLLTTDGLVKLLIGDKATVKVIQESATASVEYMWNDLKGKY